MKRALVLLAACAFGCTARDASCGASCPNRGCGDAAYCPDTICRPRCGSGDDCNPGYACVSQWNGMGTIGGAPATCLPPGYPPRCGDDDPSGGSCDVFGPANCQGEILERPWTSGHGGRCGIELVRCANGCAGGRTDGGHTPARCR